MTHDVEHLAPGAVLILGAGLAGAMCALALAPRPAVVLAPEAPGEGAASAWAQGGIAAAVGPDDSPDLHAADTIAAGAGLVDGDMARLLAQAGPGAIDRLAGLGVPFDRDAAGRYAVSLEAAHARARVVRVKGDTAGREIMRAVGRAALACGTVELRRGLRATELLRRETGAIAGALAIDGDGRRLAITADAVVLAMGGVGGLYAVTTNPKTARGDGLAMAWRVGAAIRDAEFVQFHPTAIDVGADPAPLATEALRGEGAIVVDRSGAALIDPLAPRDQVARAVHSARVEGRGAFLDARDAIGAHFPERFPTVFAACAAAGIDPRTELIPIAPAAHYHMGGVETDADGRTAVPGLWAIGESACTGVHGANRLASNSLLEAVVFAMRAARALGGAEAPSDAARRRGTMPAADPSTDLAPADLATLRSAMQARTGVERDRAGLSGLLRVLDDLARGSPDETAPNAVLAARLLARAALAREESRGGHFRTDFPERAAVAASSRQTREAAPDPEPAASGRAA